MATGMLLHFWFVRGGGGGGGGLFPLYVCFVLFLCLFVFCGFVGVDLYVSIASPAI